MAIIEDIHLNKILIDKISPSSVRYNKSIDMFSLKLHTLGLTASHEVIIFQEKLRALFIWPFVDLST